MRFLGLAVALLVACGRGGTPAPAPAETVAPPLPVKPSSSPRSAPSAAPSASATASEPRSWSRKLLTWDYAESPIGKTRVVVLSPETTERLPVLIALHGLGEAQKGPLRGARGWIDDYGLETALERIREPPLTKADMQTLGTQPFLDAVNTGLAEHPYRGLIVVCPYTPDIIGTERSLDAAVDLGVFLAEQVLPRVHAETPAQTARSATGIDGVSLGGRAALLVGLAHPDRFGVVGSLQAAIYDPDLEVLSDRVAAARGKHPDLQLRLVTSSHDFYRPVILRWSKRLKSRGLEHRLQVIDRGPHSYAFNRGLGVYAMLTFHDSALRR